jgi:DNA-binding GntR family transcriptional regulator
MRRRTPTALLAAARPKGRKTSETLPARAFGILKDAIFAGTLKPGEAVRELHLARDLQVSQATVREALVRLERVGLVTRLQHRRTTVTSFTRQEVRDRLTMRLVLEELAAVCAAERMSAERVRELGALSDAISRAVVSGDQYEHAVADMRFHQFIWRESGNAILASTLEQLTTPLFAFLSVLHQRGMYDLRMTHPHDRIVRAFASGRAEAIRKEIRDHIGGSYGDFLESGLPDLNALVSTER